MYTKMFIFAVFTILLAMISMTNGETEQRINAVLHPALTRLIRMRCTRRFSPGVCVDEVAPVWTFVFLAQNCTERLGCPNHYRANRFRSYRMCMKRCRTFVDTYLQMVELEEKNATSDNDTVINVAMDRNNTDGADKKEIDDKNLRGGFAKYYASAGGKKGITMNMDDPEEEEYKETEQANHFIVYKDLSAHDDIHPPDVDYVAGEIRSELDLLHW